MKNLARLFLSAGIALGLAQVIHASEEWAPPPTDQQIAHFFLTLNKSEVDAGQLALRTSQNPQVLQITKTLVADHSSLNVEATALFARVGLVPQDNDSSRSLQKSADDMFAKLQTLKGAEFDKVYIAHMLHGHQEAVTNLDQILIPNVKNAEFKALLVKARGIIASHLDKLAKIQL